MWRRVLGWFWKGSLALLGAGAAAVFYGTVVEPNRLVLREATVELRGYQGPPLRVALLSDLHMGSPWNGLDRLQRVVDATNATSPDLVLLLGDYDINGVLGGEPLPEAAWTGVLAGLEAPQGVYAVLGNHDWWNDVKTIQSSLEANDIRVLENRAVALDVEGERLWLVGVGDSHTGHDRVGRAFDRVPTGAAAVVMTHAPDVFDLRENRAGLTVAGHTHGGQINVPLLGAPALWDYPYVVGPYSKKGRELWVTAGIGTSLLPVRMGAPPEVVILTLKPAAPERATLSRTAP